MLHNKYLLDLAERVGSTALFAFCSTWLVTQGFSVEDLKVAGVAALAAVAKGVVARQFGNPHSASLVK